MRVVCVEVVEIGVVEVMEGFCYEIETYYGLGVSEVFEEELIAYWFLFLILG